MKEIHVKEDEMIEIVNDQEIEIQTVIGVAEVIKIGNGNDQEKEVIITDQSIERNKIRRRQR